ncbi:hypothetical protein SOVF_209150 [Spinacia oleracea]|nr:hypothetical protein SOVF_209150 [Spinacia oleracea]
MAGQKREESSPNTSSTTNNNNKNNASSSSAATPTIGSSVIPIINKLQDILSPLGSDELSKIPLPHVAVVGSQSSGKSSVLEALVGRDFLPRGCEICTRCPLILQLERRDHLQSSNHDQGGGIDIVDHDREWGEFLHMPHSRFYDFAHIRKEIQAETEREAGRNKGVSEKPIRLKISSPNILNITLIDLPGITKVPVGDQPSDIEARIRKMIMHHIRQENCIILAVSPANSDLATSDALQMAKEADPKGTRTIGVITKLDIMDRGTNACNFLLGKVIPLHLGYIGVVNRSQADINKNKSVGEALSFEEQFFNDHPVYHSIRDRCGIPQLAKKLNEILEQHIRATLPALKAQLNAYFRVVEEEMKAYGDDTESKEKQGAIVLDILRSYSEDLTDEDIRIAIQNSMGPRNKLFVPEVPFVVLIRRQIERLLDPSLQCLQFACSELIKMSRSCESRELQRFPVLRKRMDAVMLNFLYDAMKPVEKRIVDTIDMEGVVDVDSFPSPDRKAQKSQAWLSSTTLGGQNSGEDDKSTSVDPSAKLWGLPMNFWSRLSSKGTPAGMYPGDTTNHTFQTPSSIQLKEPSATIRPTEAPTEDEQTEVLVTRVLLKSYFDIVRKKVEDDVPKAVMHFLVNRLRRDLHSTFIQTIYKEELFVELLQENSEVMKKRKRTCEMYRVLQRAVQTLGEFESNIPSTNTATYQSQPQQTNDDKFSRVYLSKNHRSHRLYY